MTIPKKLRILGQSVKIRITPDIEDAGQANFDDDEILIRKQLSQTQKEITLIHEALHFANPTMKEELHSLHEAIAGQIYTILKENKLFK
jgi:hypothetical protein